MENWIGATVQVIKPNHPCYHVIGKVIAIERDATGAISFRIRTRYGYEFIFADFIYDDIPYLHRFNWNEYTDDELLARYETVIRECGWEECQLYREELKRRGLLISLETPPSTAPYPSPPSAEGTYPSHPSCDA
jgi:hypothetical protein